MVVLDKVKGELIWIGDVDDLKEADLAHIDFILNLSSWCDSLLAREQSYAHISIPDGSPTTPGEESRYEDFETAASTLWQRINNDIDENILVNCAAGISRSVSVAATAVALRRNQSFDEALGRVRSSRGIQQTPHPSLIEYGRKFVESKDKTRD